MISLLMAAVAPQEERLFDAGVLIGALLSQDLRHAEALPLVEAARRGDWAACTSTGILAEVYVHLTNERARPPHTPAEAQAALLRLIEPPRLCASWPRMVSRRLCTCSRWQKRTDSARRMCMMLGMPPGRWAAVQ
jgi:hypothetical protein